jgi:Ca2+-binding RTX toxin-like protein
VVQGDGADLELLLGDGEGEFDRLAMPGVTGSLTVTDSRITAHGHRITATGVEQLEIEGTDGRETINASAFSGFLYAFGLGGRDSITAGSGGSYVDGGDGDDTLTGGSNSDVFFGGAGNDALNGGGGDDQLSGGVGIDVLNGGAGFDVLFGEEGSDMLDGGADDDYLDGGADIDVLLGGSGADVFVMDASAPVWFLEQFLWDFNAAQGDSVFDPNNP